MGLTVCYCCWRIKFYSYDAFLGVLGWFCEVWDIAFSPADVVKIKIISDKSVIEIDNVGFLFIFLQIG